MKLTKEQVILEYENIRGNINASIGRALHVNIFIFYQEHKNRYSNFSAVMRDAIQCLLANGPDWRNKVSDDQKLDRLIMLFENLKVVAINEDKEKEENNGIDDSEGFFE